MRINHFFKENPMNKTPIFLLATGALALLTVACSDSGSSPAEPDPVIPVIPPPSPTAKLSVFVQDASTGKALEGVSIKLRSTEETAITRTGSGVASFEEVHVGSHTILAEKAGYAASVKTTSIESIASDIYIAEETTENITLYPATASLVGNLFYGSIEDASVSKPAAGAKVLIQYAASLEFLNRNYTATVDATGKYAFSKLPAAGTDYTITALEYNPGDGRTLAATPIAPVLALQNEITAYDNDRKRVYSSDVSMFVLMSYNSIVSSNEPAVFKFSDKINKDKIANKKDAVTASGEAVNVSWQDSSITVTPVGEWYGNSFTVTFMPLESVKGKPLTLSPVTIAVTKSFDLSVASVSGFAASTSTTVGSVVLNWNKVFGAAGYQVYVKTPNSGSYVLANTFGDVATGTVSVTSTGQYSFAIRAFNGTSQTAFATASINVTD
jgi:hypothetical protein